MANKSCTRCGASPCHQKYSIKKRVRDISRIWPIFDTNPVDGVVCPSCDFGFIVSRLEHDETYFEDLEELYEFVPSYCPHCGAKVIE